MANKKGFTLVEILLSAAIFMLIIYTAMLFAFRAIKLCRKIIVTAEKNQIAVILAERISLDMRAANAIMPASSIKELIIKVGSDEVAYAYINNKVRRQKNGDTAYLTNENEISGMSFEYCGNKLVKTRFDGLELTCGIQN